MPPVISFFDAVVLGIVEGLTEFLPVSSTGHLILAAKWLGLYANPASKAGVDAFEIIIQSGALLAVMGIYFPSLRAMAAGLRGRDPAGRSLFLQLVAGFLPAAVIGLLTGSWIKENLFGIGPVIFALATGGVLMLLVERYHARKAGTADSTSREKPLAAMTWRSALVIGFAQCLAMWPGTSRSMITIVAARLLGFQPKAAAEFSFLLALPTLGAATLHDLLKHGPTLLQASGTPALAVGLAVACVVAWLAVKGFLAYLTRHGMAVFGWYRIALALIMLPLVW